MLWEKRSLPCGVGHFRLMKVRIQQYVEYCITHFMFFSFKWLCSLMSSSKVIISSSARNVKENANIFNYFQFVTVRSIN
jgi:hypothetical protein